MADTFDELSLRQALVAHYQKVDALGLNEMASGNLSVRFGDQMLISPGGATGDSISVDNVVATAFDGSYEGEHSPSSE